jgi:hypothetical protein
MKGFLWAGSEAVYGGMVESPGAPSPRRSRCDRHHPLWLGASRTLALTQRGRGRACLAKLTRRLKPSSTLRSSVSWATEKTLCSGRILGWMLSPWESYAGARGGCARSVEVVSHGGIGIGFGIGVDSRHQGCTFHTCALAIPALKAAVARSQPISR